ncbi:5'-methylthioadenosine/adenosylhomocysteine nucleosidase [Larkinella terrae]|uniref:adenosylhomocysteine nucleosidase n=1 Tax=Larkinella terrae TaxID=2025311 RepID=A0A7K0EUW3_9BACT|nr:5'-methylthioadenosine/adenosylhomocysteine nucleosidase [Larkinella terrae]MRS65603.1 5'-methylthioadenosine/adenosylhomocysteine nucleosidase [Larkinella terrae]
MHPKFSKYIRPNRFLRTSLFVICLAVSTASTYAQVYKTRPITALLGAFDEEVKLVQKSLKNPKSRTLNGIHFMTGRINGRKVVVAETGIGKVNAAMTTAFVLAYFKPQRVLFTGIAGGTNPDLQPGDIVIARQTAHHDYHSITFQQQKTNQTRNAITKEMNPTYFPADSVMMQTAREAAKTVPFESIPSTSRPPSIIVGTVVTGDVFVSSEEKVASLRSDFNADATEMEGAAVAQVCYQQQIPCLVIRSLSDKANSNARQDMLTFFKIAARNSANLVMAIAGKL